MLRNCAIECQTGAGARDKLLLMAAVSDVPDVTREKTTVARGIGFP